MKIFLLMISLATHQQDIEAAKAIDKKLYLPVDRKLILLIEEESKRLKGLEDLRKRRNNMPACPIKLNYQYNLSCA